MSKGTDTVLVILTPIHRSICFVLIH